MRQLLFFAALIFGSLALPLSATAAELSGTVYSKGAPVANLTVAVKGTDVKTKTGPKGEYKLQLDPGEHTLIVRGKEFPVKVGADRTKHDIQL